MKQFLIITSLIVGALLLTALFTIGTIWHNRNIAVNLNEKIETQYAANKSNYDNMWKRFKELAKVTDMQVEQFKTAYMDMISGRSENGDLLFKMVQEQNPTLNNEVYVKLQNEISAGRKEFDNNQKQLADIVREYNAYIKVHFITAKVVGLKYRDVNEFIVISDKTEEVFKSKKDNELAI